MSPRQRALVRHALGLPNARGVASRKHFVVGVTSPDYVEWVALVAAGNARSTPSSVIGEVFLVTRQGAVRALKPGETFEEELFDGN